MNKVVKVTVYLLVIAGIIGLTAAVTASVVYKDQQEPEIIYYTQVLTRVSVQSIDEDGILVKIDEDSSFKGLKLHIANKDLSEQYTIGDYLDVYYNGTIIDDTVARFQKVYKVEKFRAENVSPSDEWVACSKDLNSAWFQTKVIPLLTKTFNADGNHTIENYQVLAQNTKQNETYAVLCRISYSKDNSATWKIVYIKDQGGVLSIIYQTTAFLTTEQIGFQNNERQ